jgi:acyl-CoA synthetase (AMP-forming)/AMP-acid ligase II
MPKGVQHTGRSITGAVRMLLGGFELPADAVVYAHNVHTFVVGALKGLRCVVAPLSITPEKFLRDVEEHRVTHAFLLPVEAWKVALHCERTGRRLPESLRHLFLFSAPITSTVLERVHALGGDDMKITCAYAMTEMVPVAWIDSREKLAWSGDGDVVGRPVPGVEARFVGEELELRGPNTFLGYVGMERVDWHRTGDNARIDDEGRIVLMGRAKDMLIRDDFNLYPGLYEPTISRIDGVGACVIIGVPDPQTADERVLLYVEPDPAARGLTSDELHKRVERGIRSGETRIDVQALPDEIRVVEQLPRSGRSHKIDRKALRVQAAASHEGAMR